jgi:hypothetical protein
VVFFGVGYVVALGSEGPTALATAQWPAVSALRLANIRRLFVSKLGLLVVVLWGIFALGYVAVRFWCLGYELAEEPNHNISARRYHVALLIVAATSLAGSQLFSNVVVLVNFFQVWGLPVVMAYLLGLPVLVLPTWWVRQRLAASVLQQPSST